MFQRKRYVFTRGDRLVDKLDGQIVQSNAFCNIFRSWNLTDIDGKRLFISHLSVFFRHNANGQPIVGEDGRREKDTVVVSPQKIKEALAESRKRYAEEHGVGLDQRAQHAREASESIEREGASARPLSLEAR